MNFTQVTDIATMNSMIKEFDLTIGRMITYRRLAGRSNCPYEKAEMESLAAAEKIVATSLRRAIETLAKGD